MRLLFFVIVLYSNLVVAAPFNLNSDKALKFAIEPIKKTDYGDFGVLIISSNDDTLNLTFEAGFTLSKDLKYIRLDLSNAQFSKSVDSNVFTADAAYATSLVAGGSRGDSYLIAEVSAPSLIPKTTSFTLQSDQFLISNIENIVSVQYRLYDTAADALNEGQVLTGFTAQLAEFVQGLGTSFSESFTHKTGFDDDFLRFIPSFRSPSVFSLGDANKTLASLSKFYADRLILQDVRFVSNSQLIDDFRDLLPNIDSSDEIATISGNFSSIYAFLNEDDSCSGASYEIAKYENVREVKVSLDTLVEYPVFCLLANTNENAIRRSEYKLNLGLGAESKLFGEITYDAAAFDLPYITTFSGYRQRILLVNHAGYDVSYITEFTAEGILDGGYDSGDAAKGIIPANTTLMVDARDLVTINSDGITRVSARILLDAKPTDITVAVQILSIGSSEPPITNIVPVIK